MSSGGGHLLLTLWFLLLLETALGLSGRALEGGLVSTARRSAEAASAASSTAVTASPVGRVLKVRTSALLSASGLALLECVLLLRGCGNRPGNVFRGVVDVQLLVDAARNRLDLSAELLFNTVEVEAVVPVDQVNSQTKVTETSGTSDSVQVGFGVLREVKVDDNVDSLDVNTTGQKIRADQVAHGSGAEIVEYPVAGMLKHLGVGVEARVAQLGDLLREQLNTGRAVAEDDGLVDLQLAEQGVETVDLLLLLNERVVLGNSAERQLVHQVDLVRVAHVLVFERLHNIGEGCREKHDLPILRVELQKLLDGDGEFRRQKLVSLVHDKGVSCGEIGHALGCEIEDTTGSTNNHVNSLVQSNNVILETSTSGGDHDVNAKMLSECFAHLRGLESQFSGRHEQQRLSLLQLRVDALECRNHECGRFARAVLCTRQNISACDRNGDCLLLNG